MDGMKTHAILLFSATLALGGCATDDARLRELDEALREAVRDAWAKAEAAASQDEVAPPSGGEVPGGETPPINNQTCAPACEAGAEGGPAGSPASAQHAGLGALPSRRSTPTSATSAAS